MESTIMLWVVALVCLVYLVMMMKSIGERRLPPGSLGIPIIGQTLEFHKALHSDKGEEWLQQRARKYGPVSKMNLFGRRTVFLTGQAYNKFIFMCDEQTLSSKRPKSMRQMLGDRNLFEMDSEDHRRLRTAIFSFLTVDALKKYVDAMDQEVRLHLAEHWHHDHVISTMPLMKTLTFNIICTLLFGIERGERRKKLKHLFKYVINGLLVMPINLPFTRYNRCLRARSEAGAIFKALIREKREKLERGEAEPDLISSLVGLRDDAGSPLLSDQEIEDNCVLGMIAAHDSSSILLTFLIKLIAEHPNVHEDLLSEHKEIARGKKSASDPLTWEDIRKMKYTWRVATETMRLHPPALLGFRTAVRDIEIGGYVIPKGWQVIWSGSITQMDESIYPDPHKFNPSRFEGQGAPPHTILTFGGGARLCPGLEFVKMETLAMIHYLVTRFTWKLCLEDNEIIRDPTPVFKEGLPIHIKSTNPL